MSLVQQNMHMIIKIIPWSLSMCTVEIWSVNMVKQLVLYVLKDYTVNVHVWSLIKAQQKSLDTVKYLCWHLNRFVCGPLWIPSSSWEATCMQSCIGTVKIPVIVKQQNHKDQWRWYYLLSGRKKLLGKRYHSLPTQRLISESPENCSV